MCVCVCVDVIELICCAHVHGCVFREKTALTLDIKQSAYNE